MGFKKTALIATAMLVLGCETTDVQKANLVEGGTKSGVLVKLDGFIPHFQELHLRPNNPSFSSSSLVKFIFEKNQSDYVFTTLKPGHYYIHSLSQQKHWVSCFHSNTISFEVKPNSVTFLGNYNTIKNGAQLQNIALNKGHNRAVQSQVYFYTEDILPPAISQPNEIDLIAAKEFLKNEAPSVALPAINALHSPHSYETSKNLFTREPTCP